MQPSEPELAAAAAAFTELVAHTPFAVGKAISARERARLGVPDELLPEHSSLVYGETSLATVARVLAVAEQLRRPPAVGGDGDADDGVAAQQRAEVFLDVGSGLGKPVFAAALLRPWALCAGVELLAGLHETARHLQEAWDGGLPFVVRGVRATQFRVPASARATRIALRRGDAASAHDMARTRFEESGDEGGEGAGEDWDADGGGEARGERARSEEGSGAAASLWACVDVAYACSTCFDETTVARVATAAMAMRPGSLFATAGVRLPTEWGALVAELEGCDMSWGRATVFVHERAYSPPQARLTAPPEAAGAGGCGVQACVQAFRRSSSATTRSG